MDISKQDAKNIAQNARVTIADTHKAIKHFKQAIDKLKVDHAVAKALLKKFG